MTTKQRLLFITQGQLRDQQLDVPNTAIGGLHTAPIPKARSNFSYSYPVTLNSIQALRPRVMKILKNSHLKRILLNSRIIVNKTLDLQAELAIHHIDIACVTETWPCPDIADSEILDVSQYHIFRIDRNRHGSGRCIIRL